MCYCCVAASAAAIVPPAEFDAVVATAFVGDVTLLFLLHAHLCFFLRLLSIFCFVVPNACAPVVAAPVAAVAAAVVFAASSAVDVAVAAAPAAATSGAPVTSLHASSELLNAEQSHSALHLVTLVASYCLENIAVKYAYTQCGLESNASHTLNARIALRVRIFNCYVLQKVTLVTCATYSPALMTC